MTSQAVMKRYIQALAKKNQSNSELQKISTAISNFKKLTKEQQAKVNNAVQTAYEKLQAKGVSVKKVVTKATPSPKPTPSTNVGLKAVLAELKKKLGAEKFKDATTGTDILKDIQIPALKKGKRIVRKKGKTTNQYGTFKNKVGRPYWENRANRYDANQPSQTRKYKLADGGQTNESVEIGGFKRNIMGTLSFDLKLKKMRKSQEFIVYPAQEKSDSILIQSSTRIGKIEMTSGEGFMSQSHANGAYGYHLQADKKDKFQLSEEQLSKLKEELAKTAGKKVGSSVVFSDNSFADKFAKGGEIGMNKSLSDSEKKMLKAQLSIIQRKFDYNEDNNNHSENVVLLADAFGNASEKREAKRILELHEKEGSLSSANGLKRRELSFKLFEKWDKAREEAGILAKGGEVERGSAHIYISKVNGNYEVYHGDNVTLRKNAKPLYTRENAPEGTWDKIWAVLFDKKYADGGEARRLTQAEKEEAEREIREAWEGKNIDDYVMYSDRYKKGGKTGQSGRAKRITRKGR